MIVGVIWRKPVLTHASIVCEGMLASVNSVNTVCNVDVLWPNGWMDQDATWHGGRPRPRHITLHIVSDDDPTPYPLKGTQPVSPIFGPYLLWPNGWMDQDAACRDVGLGQSDIVLDGVPAPLPKKGTQPSIFGPHLLWPNGWICLLYTSPSPRDS